MSMRQILQIQLDLELFDLEEIEKAEALARSENGIIYTWETVGKHNWLRRGVSRINSLGLFVLPSTLPEIIGMPDDVYDEDDLHGDDRE